nr:hypothetical protein GCM10020185_05730 [Pseudomonas brassicacearum subsp. brassicacearum]
MADDHAWLAFMDKGLPRLRAANWQIDIEAGFHFDLQPLEQLYADIEESPGREWFDLQLGIVVDGKTAQPAADLASSAPLKPRDDGSGQP